MVEADNRSSEGNTRNVLNEYIDKTKENLGTLKNRLNEEFTRLVGEEKSAKAKEVLENLKSSLGRKIESLEHGVEKTRVTALDLIDKALASGSGQKIAQAKDRVFGTIRTQCSLLKDKIKNLWEDVSKSKAGAYLKDKKSKTVDFFHKCVDSIQEAFKSLTNKIKGNKGEENIVQQKDEVGESQVTEPEQSSSQVVNDADAQPSFPQTESRPER